MFSRASRGPSLDELAMGAVTAILKNDFQREQ